MIIATSDYPRILEELEKRVPQYGKLEVKMIHKNGTVVPKRIVRSSSGGFGIMLDGSRKYCRTFAPSNLNAFVEIRFTEKKKSEKDKWEESWKKVLARLEKSGLWKDYANDIRLALEIGYEKIQKAKKADSSGDPSIGWDEMQALRKAKIAEIDPRLVGENGSTNTNILWHVSSVARVKKMYFGKYLTENRLQEIKELLVNKKHGRVYNRADYDVSFQYSPEVEKAWYSEEFIGCGNGHYYLALDETHALFYEDD